MERHRIHGARCSELQIMYPHFTLHDDIIYSSKPTTSNRHRVPLLINHLMIDVMCCDIHVLLSVCIEGTTCNLHLFKGLVRGKSIVMCTYTVRVGDSGSKHHTRCCPRDRERQNVTVLCMSASPELVHGSYLQLSKRAFVIRHRSHSGTCTVT